ncbi:MAG: pyridoxine 5'-phosphate synthase [Deltaproteobacteria bacterium]|nr:pyridoxine 5'-phosphate synthase [Deltaproteobacteria bacterium]
MARLGVNIDHVATLRQVRRVAYPEPLEAARAAEAGGADAITVHLREDRRHIQDADVAALRATLRVPLNLEMAATPAMVAIALRMRPADVCLVPERRQEVTTEGGLDAAAHEPALRAAVARLKRGGICVSLFVDPEPVQLEASARIGADAVELHTGRYAEHSDPSAAAGELAGLAAATARGRALGLVVNAGHGLRYDNTRALAAIAGIDTLNIGHSIVARALIVGMERAVREMRALVAA